MHEVSREMGGSRLRIVSALPGSVSWLGVWLVSRFAAVIYGAIYVPDLVSRFYVPFVSNFLAQPSLDPWFVWVNGGGAPEAFPYSWPLLLGFALFEALGVAVGSNWAAWLAALLIMDFAIAILIPRFANNRQKATAAQVLYALAPTPIVGLALLGSLDFFPAVLLMLALLATRNKKFLIGGIFFGLAISSKFLLAIVLVPLIAYAFRSRLTRREGILLSTTSLLSAMFFSSPLLYSDSFRGAFINSPAASGPLTWGLESQGVTLLVWPLVILGSWLGVWRLRRMSFDLLLVSVATPLALTAAMPGAPAGWMLWIAPILLTLLVGLPSRYIAMGFLVINLPILNYLSGLGPSFFGTAYLSLINSLIATATIGLASLLLILMWKELVTKSDFVRLQSKPALILIAGDSGVGKDTLSEGLARALGERSCVKLSGDDYHLWDRGQGAWQYVTHLNPSANDLSKFFNDILNLSSGREVSVGHYDHQVGRRLSRSTSVSREFVFASGLHALWSNDVNRSAALSIFMEMEEDLRVALKVRRDTGERGQTEDSIRSSILARRDDANKFIFPQAANADLVVAVSRVLSTGSYDGHRIHVTSEPKLFDNQLVSELANTCGLEVVLQVLDNGKRTIEITGDTDQSSLSMAFERIEPRVSGILGNFEDWSMGSMGIMEMICLVYLANSLRRERLL